MNPFTPWLPIDAANIRLAVQLSSSPADGDWTPVAAMTDFAGSAFAELADRPEKFVRFGVRYRNPDPPR